MIEFSKEVMQKCSKGLIRAMREAEAENKLESDCRQLCSAAKSEAKEELSHVGIDDEIEKRKQEDMK